MAKDNVSVSVSIPAQMFSDILIAHYRHCWVSLTNRQLITLRHSLEENITFHFDPQKSSYSKKYTLKYLSKSQ